MTTRTPLMVFQNATLGYREHRIIEDLSAQIPENSFTAVIGPNGCGKSTLLRALARVLTPSIGEVLLEGRPLSSYKTKELARKIGLLPQTSTAPDGIRVADLVSRGRSPHQSILQQWRPSHQQAVAETLEATKLTSLSHRNVDELSGGQRQRVWVALLLAQQTPILLLDEPTTFLDIAHQFDLMELFRSLHEQGKTIVAVLHDLNQAARYADHLIVMDHGAVVAIGKPSEVLTAELVERVFRLPAIVVPDPVTGTPSVVALDPRQPSAPPIPNNSVPASPIKTQGA